MKTNLSRRIAGLPPAVRRLVLRLAAGSDDITRKVAHAGLSELSATERAGIMLGVGKILVSDLAREIRSTPRVRRPRLEVTARTSSLARGRADLARRIDGPLWERARLRNRRLIVAAAQSALPQNITAQAGWLVYPVEAAEVGVASSEACLSHGSGFYSHMHTLLVPRNWRSQVAQIGDGKGFIGDYLILSGRLLANVAGTKRAIYEVVVAYAGTPDKLDARIAYASCWPNGVIRLFGRFGSAYDDCERSEDLRENDDLKRSVDKADLAFAA